MVIELEVRRFLDLEAFEHGLQLFSFRLWTRVQFQTTTGWTPVVAALIDTGAPFSVVPRNLWSDLEVEGRFATHLRGLVPFKSAVLNASLGQVTYIVSDLRRRLPPMPSWALLAEGDVPVILGCAGFLDRVRLVLDASHQRGSIELA